MKVSVVVILLATSLLTVACHGKHEQAITPAELELRLGMQQLWEEHVVWTRLYVISAVDGSPDTDLVAQRLLRNQEDIGNAIKPYYGEEAGEQLTALLKDHILIAAQIIEAAKEGDSAGVESAQANWGKNADDIAALLSSANPAWPQEEVKHMLHMHLDLTTQEAVARLQGNYAEDIASYDKVHVHAVGMAETFSEGIIQQFPERFAS